MYLLLFLLGVMPACRKENKGSDEKKCNYTLFALQATRPGYYKLVTVDTATGNSIDNLPFPDIYGSQGYLDPRSKCYYSIEADSAGGMKLYKMDLVSKTTSVFNSSGWGGKSSFGLTYSTVSKLFYFLYVDETNYIPESFLYSIATSGDSFKYESVDLKPRQYDFYNGLLANEKTGEIYFVKRHSRYKINPINYEVGKVSNGFEIAGWPYYSRNDDMIYGARSGGGDTLILLKENPEDGTISRIGAVSPPVYPVYNFDTKYVGGAFDECRNQYIFHKVVSDNKAYLYWLDVKSGRMVKHLKPQEPYARLFCLN